MRLSEQLSLHLLSIVCRTLSGSLSPQTVIRACLACTKHSPGPKNRVLRKKDLSFIRGILSLMRNVHINQTILQMNKMHL